MLFQSKKENSNPVGANGSSRSVFFRMGNGYPYVAMYAIVLIVCSIPNKFVFYLSGPLLLLLGVIFRGFLDLRHFYVIILFVLFAALSLLLENNISIFSLVLWPLTYGVFVAFLLYLLFSPRRFVSQGAMQALVQLATYWLCIQGAVGVVQYALTGNPDAVAGTVGLFDFIVGITVSQVYFGFAVLSILPLIIFWPYRLRFRRMAIILGSLAVIASQSGHGTISFIVSFVIIYVLTSINVVRQIFRATVVASFVALAMFWLFPNTWEVAKYWYIKTLEYENPKTLMFSQLVDESVDDLKLMVAGSGPGQYLSRASLTGSGLLTNFTSELQSSSERVRESLSPMMRYYLEVGGGSAISKPYNSFMSIYSEWGAVISIILAFYFIKIVAENVLKGRAGSIEEKILRRYMAFYILFLCAVSLVELYFEMPAAIAPGGFLAVVALARAKQLGRVRKFGFIVERDCVGLKIVDQSCENRLVESK